MNGHELRAFSKTIRGEYVAVNKRREHRPVEHEFASRMDRIVEATARHTGVSALDILAKDRRSHIAFARKLAMYLVREITQASYLVIGDYFLRDHSTVIYAHDSIERRMKKSEGFAFPTRSLLRAIIAADACTSAAAEKAA